MTVEQDPAAAGDDVFYDAEEDETQDRDAGSASNASTNHAYPLHRAAFNGDVLRIKQLLVTLTPEQQRQLDPHGNNALHVAAWRQMHASVAALLDGGFPAMAKSSRGWTALDEAVAAKDRALAHTLQKAAVTQARLEMKARRLLLLDTMRGMPDFSMQLKWELGSSVPGLGMLLRRYAPHDLYHIWKVGDRLRVDGTLMGLDTKSLIPEWKRGHFSLVFDGSNCTHTASSSAASSAPNGTTPSSRVGRSGPRSSGPGEGGAASSSSPSGPSPRLLFLNRGKGYFVDVGADKKAMKATEDAELAAALDADLDEAMTKDVDRVRFKAAELRFVPVRGWLGGELTEKVEGWSCKVYEATGKVKTVSTFKAAFKLPPGASFDDYLAAVLPYDPKQESFFDPLWPGGTGDGPGSSSRHRPAAGSSHSAADGEPDGNGEASTLDAGHSRSSNQADTSRSGAEAATASSSRGPANEAGAPAPSNNGQMHSSRSGSQRSLRGPSSPSQTSTRSPAQARLAATASTSAPATASGMQPPGKQRVISARCWMARDFPMSLEQLLPLLDVIGTANKQLAKVGKFMRQYGAADMGLFPVKVNVPLLMTVYALVSFKHFKELPRDGLGGLAPDFFEVPPGFTRKNLADLMDKLGGGMGPSKERPRAKRAVGSGAADAEDSANYMNGDMHEPLDL